MLEWIADAKVSGPVSFIGTILTVIGLILTYMQALRAKNASIAARQATIQMKGYFDLASTNYAEALIPALKKSMHDSNFELAE